MEIQLYHGLSVIPDTKKVKVINMGHIIEVMAVENCNHDGLPIRKISKDEYIALNTGEIRKYNHSVNRMGNVDNLRRTFKKIRHLINYNFHGADNELLVTITYKENMTDIQRLYDDFRKFIMRLRYKYPNIDYLNIVEPQGRGAWHCHLLIRFNDVDKIYIPNKKIADMWGNGFVSVKSIKKGVDNLGAYLSAYLGDVELNDDNIRYLSEKGVNSYAIKVVDNKRFIKGGRLYMYPPGMNIYRKSKGIVDPPAEWVEYQEVKKITGSGIPDYTVTYCVYENAIKLNSITYEHYNLLRNTCK